MTSRPHDFLPALGKALDTLRAARSETTPDRRLGRTRLGFRELLRYESSPDFKESERPILEEARLQAVRFLMDGLSDESLARPTTWTKYFLFLSVEAAETRELLEAREPDASESWERFTERLPEMMDETLGLTKN